MVRTQPFKKEERTQYIEYVRARRHLMKTEQKYKMFMNLQEGASSTQGPMKRAKYASRSMSAIWPKRAYERCIDEGHAITRCKAINRIGKSIPDALKEHIAQNGREGVDYVDQCANKVYHLPRFGDEERCRRCATLDIELHTFPDELAHSIPAKEGAPQNDGPLVDFIPEDWCCSIYSREKDRDDDGYLNEISDSDQDEFVDADIYSEDDNEDSESSEDEDDEDEDDTIILIVPFTNRNMMAKRSIASMLRVGPIKKRRISLEDEDVSVQNAYIIDE